MIAGPPLWYRSPIQELLPGEDYFLPLSAFLNCLSFSSCCCLLVSLRLISSFMLKHIKLYCFWSCVGPMFLRLPGCIFLSTFRRHSFTTVILFLWLLPSFFTLFLHVPWALSSAVVFIWDWTANNQDVMCVWFSLTVSNC